MIRYLITTLLLLAAFNSLHAQKRTKSKLSNQWTMDNGLLILNAPMDSIYINNVFNKDTNVYIYNVGSFGLNYFLYPKYHFYGGGNDLFGKETLERPFSLSIGSPFAIGLGFISASGVRFMYEIAPMLDINFGFASPYNDSRIGAFAGIGIGICNGGNTNGTYTYSSLPYSSKYKTVNKRVNDYIPSSVGFGPRVHGGILFGNNNNASSRIGINASYQYNVLKGGLSYYSIGLQLPFFIGRAF